MFYSTLNKVRLSRLPNLLEASVTLSVLTDRVGINSTYPRKLYVLINVRWVLHSVLGNV